MQESSSVPSPEGDPVLLGPIHATPSLTPTALSEQHPDPKMASNGEAPPLTSQDIAVKYNVNRIFVEGVILSFDFKLTPRTEGLSNVRLLIQSEYLPRVIPWDHPLSPPAPGHEMPISVDFKAPKGFQGMPIFWVYFGYTKAGQEHWTATSVSHKVYRAKEKARQVIENLKIELINRLNQPTGANETAINQTLEGLDALRPLPDDPVKDLETVILPPIWEPLLLQHVSPDKAPNPKAKASGTVTTEKLTMFVGNRRIHLLSGTKIELGRDLENDVVTMVFDSDGTFAEEKSSLISRHHCHIEIEKNRCLLVDPSSNSGTYLNGKRVNSGSAVEIRSGTEATIGLACMDVHRHSCPLSLQIRVWTSKEIAAQCRCDEIRGSAPSCLIIKRLDSVPETFVVVWQCCPLRMIAPEMSGWADFCVVRQAGGLRYRHASREGVLTPGAKIALSDGELDMREYQQWGLDP